MNDNRKLLAVAFVPACLLGLAAADSPTERTPLMTERGELLYRDDFAGKTVGADWRAAKGRWEIVEGALRGAELKADQHGAVIRCPLDFDDVIIQYAFRLKGARMTTLSLNHTKGHLCRVSLARSGVTVTRDKTSKDPGVKAAVLETYKTPLEEGRWYTLLVEIQGGEMLASLDDRHFALGEDRKIDGPKANLGLTVAGESAEFDNLRVWEASPRPDWSARKKALLEGRAAPSATTAAAR